MNTNAIIPFSVCLFGALKREESSMEESAQRRVSVFKGGECFSILTEHQ